MIDHSSFNMICWLWIICGLITFPILLRVPQPYGRHSKSNWGPMINNRIGWFLMELPALVVFGYFLSYASEWHNKLLLVPASLWGLHYVLRAVIYPFRIQTKGKKMPLVIMLSAIFFNTVNGFLNGYWLARFAPEVGTNILTDVRLIAGILLFLAGFTINQYHDRTLIRLRTGKKGGYQIPYGGLFKYVSCPNFLGEIISWLGFLVVGLSWPALAFLVWTLVNLIPRALDHHRWYKKEFQAYPANRKAIFPFIL